MGSFAYSVHVKSTDARGVAAAAAAALREAGYEPTDQAPPLGPLTGQSEAHRGIHVADARDGWVGLLDSAIERSEELAAELSRRLDTDAVHVLVNDSDDWHYSLYRGGRQVDAFSSVGDEDDDGELEMTPAMERLVESGGLEGLSRALGERLQQFRRQMDEMMPPEVARLKRKVEEGTATPEEAGQYVQWARRESGQFLAGFLREDGFGLGSAGQPPDEEDREAHLEQLRPLLRPGVADDRVLAVLGRHDLFAEETLKDFLPLLGIAPLYAQLSYAYLREFRQGDLEPEGIRLSQHLQFRR
jgi:hypothetical protein